MDFRRIFHDGGLFVRSHYDSSSSETLCSGGATMRFVSLDSAPNKPAGTNPGWTPWFVLLRFLVNVHRGSGVAQRERSAKMKPAPSRIKMLGITAALVIIAVSWVCFSLRPAMVVSSATPLWVSEYDASRMGTTYPGPGVALAQMRRGEELRVVWIAQGKD